MSGGFFEYKQYHLNDIIDSIERELNQQGKLKPKSELFSDEKYYQNNPEEKFYYSYPVAVLDKMKEAVAVLKIAEIYVQRIDWLISGDDGEQTFLERLANELIKKENEVKLLKTIGKDERKD